MLVGRESLRQPDPFVLIEHGAAIERLAMIVVHFLLQQPLGFGETFIVRIARCPALHRQDQQHGPQQRSGSPHDDPPRMSAHGLVTVRPERELRELSSRGIENKIIYIKFYIYLGDIREKPIKKGPLQKDGPFMSCLSRGQRKYEATEYTGSDPDLPGHRAGAPAHRPG